MTNKQKLLGFLLLILTVTASYSTYYWFFKKTTFNDGLRIRGTAKPPSPEEEHKDVKLVKSLHEFRKIFLYFKSDNPADWKTYPEELKNSSWEQKEIAEAEMLTTGQKYDVIVLPVQLNEMTVDRVSRLTSSRYIADEIKQRTSEKVMPVELVQRLLGSRAYWFSDADVNRITEKYQAKKVIHIYAKRIFGGKGGYLFGIVVTRGGAVESVELASVPLPAKEKTLELVVAENVAKILGKIYPASTVNIYSDAKYEVLENFRFTDNFADFINSGRDPLSEAVKLQILGMLVPVRDAYQRKRFMERSLLALRHVDPAVKNHNTLMARALFYLYRRPVAMKYLENATTPEAKALQAFLNGNFTALRDSYKEITNPAFRMFTYLELYDLGRAYNINNVSSITIDGFNEGWMKILNHKTSDQDVWYTPDNIRFYVSQKGMFPAYDELMLDFMKGKLVVGENYLSDPKMQTVFLEIHNKFIEQNEKQICCEIFEDKTSLYDVLSLYKSNDIANILRNIYKKLHVQALPEQAKTLSDAYEIYYSGHTGFMYYRASIMDSLLRNAGAIERQNYIRSTVETALAIRELAAGTDTDSIFADYLISKYLDEYRSNQQRPIRFNTRGFRIAEDMPTGISYYENQSRVESLDYTNTDFYVLETALQKKQKLPILRDFDSGIERAEEYLMTRFDGHPAKTPFMADRYIQQDKKQEALQVLNDAVRNQSENFEVYSKLAGLLLEEGDYKQTDEIFKKYPGFSDIKPANNVEVSNYLYTAGNGFYWRGELEQAKYYYGKSAELQTGSEASLTSAQRVALMDKNYLLAANLAQHTASRYNDVYRYRDYLTFLYLFGLNEQANSGFQQLYIRYKTPQLWTGMFVGQRINKLTFERLGNWLVNYKKLSNEVVQRHADRYALQQAMIDRSLVAEDIENLLRVFEENSKLVSVTVPVKPVSRLYGYLTETVKDMPTVPSEETMKDLGAIPKKPAIPAQPLKPEDIVPVPNQYVLFLKAYKNILDKKYREAFEEYVTYSRFHKVEEYDYSLGEVVLPYAAYAAVQSGNTEKLDSYLLNEFSRVDAKKFDYHLASAVIAAGKNEIDLSLNHIEKSFNLRPHTDYRVVFTWYELTQFCEWLYELTSDKRYLEKALNWIKKYQVIEPHFSWAYSFEAKYSKNMDEKIRATAFALYLDPNSKWLQSVPASVKTKAKKWWVKNNPFKLPENKPKRADKV